MPKFLFVYRKDRAAYGNLTTEEWQVRQQKWHEWVGKGLQQGWLLEPGDALKPEGRVITSKNVILDGPFIESKELVGGFSIVEAASMDAAVELGKSCPVLLFGASVEVRCLADFTKKS